MIDKIFSQVDQPLYLSQLARRFEGLDTAERSRIVLELILDKGGRHKTLTFWVPARATAETSGLQPDRTDLRTTLIRYVQARINNLLSCFDGLALTLYADLDNTWLYSLLEEALAAFDWERPDDGRQGLGAVVNALMRINRAKGVPPCSLELCKLSAFKPRSEATAYRLPRAQDSAKARQILQNAANTLTGRSFLGLDIGGNAVKLAVVVDGRALLLKTYAWFPTHFCSADELLRPLLLLSRFAALLLALYKHNRQVKLEPAWLDENCSAEELEKACLMLGALLTKVDSAAGQAKCVDAGHSGSPAPGQFESPAPDQFKSPDLRQFDAVVAGFPDIVSHNQISGGETYKQRGIRQAHPLDYARELAKMAALDRELAAYVKPGGVVELLNDGALASFVLSVEQVFDPGSRLQKDGMFAFTIGTEMGTGYISESAAILPFPMECYNAVIDLGNDGLCKFSENDVRSIRNFNTRVPGSVQKYISQSGLIRFACEFMAEEAQPELLELFERGWLSYDEKNDQLMIQSEPADCRGPLTRQLVDWLKSGQAGVHRAYEAIARALAVVLDELLFLFPERSPRIFVSGGLVNAEACFTVLRDALAACNANYELLRLDSRRAHSPLLAALDEQQANYMVALGAAYLGNLLLQEPGHDPHLRVD